jgi:hypothetical protein
MSEAVLPADLNVGLVERCTDGIRFQDGLMQGIRFDVYAGKPTFRVGTFREEHADITVEITAVASRELNALYGMDPRFQATLSRLQESGNMRIDGGRPTLGRLIRGDARPHRRPYGIDAQVLALFAQPTHFGINKVDKSMKHFLKPPSMRHA